MQNSIEPTQKIPNPIKRKSTPLSQLKSFKEKKNQEDVEILNTPVNEKPNIVDHYEEEDTSESEIEQFNEQDVTPSMSYEEKKNVVMQNLCSVTDLQILLMVIIIVFLIQLIPTHKIIEKYIAIDKIPFGDAISKSILAGIVVFIVIKLIKY